MSTQHVKYRAALGQHLGDFADGRLIEPGQTYKLDAKQVEDPHNARLIAEGKLLPVPEPAPKAKTPAPTKESD